MWNKFNIFQEKAGILIHGCGLYNNKDVFQLRYTSFSKDYSNQLFSDQQLLAARTSCFVSSSPDLLADAQVAWTCTVAPSWMYTKCDENTSRQVAMVCGSFRSLYWSLEAWKCDKTSFMSLVVLIADFFYFMFI